MSINIFLKETDGKPVTKVNRFEMHRTLVQMYSKISIPSNFTHDDQQKKYEMKFWFGRYSGHIY
jgi:hypothetical protein